MARMPDSPADDLSKFDRQRRNVVLAWAVLFFYQTVEPRFDRITVPGAQLTLELGHAERIVFWLWALLAYFLVRYNQFFNRVARPLIGQDVRATYGTLADQAAKEAAIPLVRREHPELQGKEIWCEVQVRDNRPDEMIYRVKRVYWKEDPSSTNASSLDTRAIDLRLPKRDLWWFKQKARAYVAWASPYFTEYWLPFWLPWISITYGLFTNWSAIRSWF